MTNILLNRGGAGKTITRQETAEHLTDVMQRLIHVVAGYDTLSPLFDDSGQQERIEERQQRSRAEMAKVAELILSSGATPPREPAPDTPLPSAETPAEALEALVKVERSFKDAIKKQLKLSHQLRTQALLENLMGNADQRIDLIHKLSTEYGVTVA